MGGADLMFRRHETDTSILHRETTESESCGVPVYSLAITGIHFAFPERWRGCQCSANPDNLYNSTCNFNIFITAFMHIISLKLLNRSMYLRCIRYILKTKSAFH